MERTLCNMEKFINHDFVECGGAAKWSHPRYTDGVFCDNCKEKVSAFFAKNWTRIKEDQDGKGSM